MRLPQEGLETTMASSPDKVVDPVEKVTPKNISSKNAPSVTIEQARISSAQQPRNSLNWTR
jgi:hypothetical protein